MVVKKESKRRGGKKLGAHWEQKKARGLREGAKEENEKGGN